MAMRMMFTPIIRATMSASPRLPSSAVRVFAWAGGALFVGSLAWFVFFYYAVLGHRAAPREILVPHLAIDVLLFGAFAVHHSLFARDRVKQLITRRLPASLERSTYVWVASLLFALVCLAWRPVPGGELYRVDGWPGWVIRGVQVFGLFLSYRVASALDVLELAGIRQALGQAKKPRIEVVGPYRWVRHPLYAAWIMFVFGSPDMSVDRLTFAVVSSAYIVVAIPWEERSLRASLGEGYSRYMEAVKWRVLPFVY
jgi:protein-S-isoprenylcysteine O-methyltransferase Ste14